RRLGDRRRLRAFGEFQVDDLDLVAALLVEADRRAHQRRNPVELFLGALLVDQLALFVLGIGTVDQHRDGDAVDAAGLGHLGLGGARNLVIVGFLGLLALVAGLGAVGVVLVAGQLVVDGDLAAVAGRGGGFLARLARSQHAALGVELVRGLGDLVVVEVGRELDAGAAGAYHRGDDILDLLAHPLLVGVAALVADGLVDV